MVLGFFCLFVFLWGFFATIVVVAAAVAAVIASADADADADADVDDEGELHVVRYVWWTLYNLRPAPHICWKYGHNVP